MRRWNSRIGVIDHGATEHTEIGEKEIQIPRDLHEICYRTIGAAMDVHRELGPGFIEAAYEEAMAIELELRDIPFERQVQMPILYKVAL